MRNAFGRETKPTTAGKLFDETKEQVGNMSLAQILSQHPTPEQIAESDRRMLAEADDRWRRSLSRSAGLPEPFSPTFSKRLASTYRHNLKFWGKFFQRAIESGVNDAG